MAVGKTESRGNVGEYIAPVWVLITRGGRCPHAFVLCLLPVGYTLEVYVHDIRGGAFPSSLRYSTHNS